MLMQATNLILLLAVVPGSNDRFYVEKDGTTARFAGTVPAAPNISLNADGSATFASNLQVWF